MYTGRMLEEEVLQRCAWIWNGGYVPYNKSIANVKKFQPWNPSDPSSLAANDLHALVVEALGIDDYSAVSFFTAIGSPLDIFHGIDGFVEWKGVVVTIDITANPLKIEHKADIILHEKDVYDENGQVNLPGLRRIGEETARLLQHRAAA